MSTVRKSVRQTSVSVDDATRSKPIALQAEELALLTMTDSYLAELSRGLVTVRPGRELLVRKVRIGETTEASASSKTLQLVLVHGTCGTQAQYDFLLTALSTQVLDFNRNAQENVSLECLLYDCLGCGESAASTDMSDYARVQSCADLQALVDTETDPNLPLIFIGHSYGPNLFLNLTKPLPNAIGFVFLGSAIRTPSLPHLDGGHSIFRLPLLVLDCLQPSLNKAFVQQAVHPLNTEIQQLSSDECNHNSMFIAKAYHTQTQWTPPEQLVQVTNDKACLVIHGEDDLIIPIAAAQELANLVNAPMHAVSVASHLVMMEQPDKVASILWRFLRETCI